MHRFLCLPSATGTRHWLFHSFLIATVALSISFFACVGLAQSVLDQSVLDQSESDRPNAPSEKTYPVFYSVDELPIFHSVDADQSGKAFDATVLVALLKSSVAPESWRQPGVDIRVSPSIASLIVRQTKSNHLEIAKWLERLREFTHPDSQQHLLDALTDVGSTNRRVLLIVGRPESRNVELAFEVYQTPSLRSTTDHFVLRCVGPVQQTGWTEPLLSAAKNAPQGLAVLSADGKVIQQLPFSGQDLTPATIKAFLRATEVPLPTVETVLSNAMKLAQPHSSQPHSSQPNTSQPDSSQPSGKRILMVLSEPGCVHCIRMQQFLKAYNSLFESDYVIVSIDTRMSDVESQTKRLGRTENDIPWYVILDHTGKPLVTSESPTGNIGFPTEPAEIEHFRQMLVQTRLRLTDEQINQISALLGGKN